jgi:signal transduction histidine kinase
VYNLLSNAVKFTPEGGSVRFNARAKVGEIVFAVQDTGPGVPAEYRARIFDEFVQLPGEQEGTGLGLAVVKRLVELHGGAVSVDSAEGGGSTFAFTIPRQTRG